MSFTSSVASAMALNTSVGTVAPALTGAGPSTGAGDDAAFAPGPARRAVVGRLGGNGVRGHGVGGHGVGGHGAGNGPGAVPGASTTTR